MNGNYDVVIELPVGLLGAMCWKFDSYSMNLSCFPQNNNKLFLLYVYTNYNVENIQNKYIFISE